MTKYYPYLRGKQFELLAIQDLLKKGLLSRAICPIIEPIKLTTTFKNTIKLFDDNDYPLYIIENPKVGSLKDNGAISISKYTAVLNNNIDSDTYDISGSLKMEIFNDRASWKNDLDSDDSHEYLKVIEDDKLPAIRKFNSKKLIALTDRFLKEDKNADYTETPEIFSTDFIDYKDNFIGFSDYSIVGKEYNESGFAPRAVAIHIVYINENNELWIRHFVSNTNGDITNTAGKFREALDKLVDWYNNLSDKMKKINRTDGMEEFLSIYNNNSYPGLGYVKKLSIKHHLEVVGKLLDFLEE